MKELIKKNKHLIFICFCLFFTIVIYFIKIVSIQPDRHLPMWSDEFLHYVNSYNFYINTTTQAAFTFGGKGAIVGGGSAHGFMYYFFHGSVAKLFGWSNLTMIINNYVLVFLTILVVFVQKIKRFTIINKVFASLLILSFPFLPVFLQTYMQEVINVFFAVCCSVFVAKIYEENNESKVKIIVSFICFLAFISLFRPLWLFWIVVLIPLSKSRKEFAFWIILTTISFSTSFVFIKLFFESVPDWFTNFTILLRTESLHTLVHMFTSHARHNIFQYRSLHSDFIYNLMKFSYVFIIIYFFVRFLLKKNRIDLACFLVLTLNISMLILFYDAYQWREIRSLAPIYYFSCIFIALHTTNIQKYLLLALLLPSFFFVSFNNPFEKLQNKNSVHEVERLRSILQDSLSNLNIDKKTNTILVNYSPSDYSCKEISFPVRTRNNIPIRYIVPYYEVEKAEYFFVLDKDEEEKLFFQKKSKKPN